MRGNLMPLNTYIIDLRIGACDLLGDLFSSVKHILHCSLCVCLFFSKISDTCKQNVEGFMYMHFLFLGD